MLALLDCCKPCKWLVRLSQIQRYRLSHQRWQPLQSVIFLSIFWGVVCGFWRRVLASASSPSFSSFLSVTASLTNKLLSFLIKLWWRHENLYKSERHPLLFLYLWLNCDLLPWSPLVPSTSGMYDVIVAMDFCNCTGLGLQSGCYIYIYIYIYDTMLATVKRLNNCYVLTWHWLVCL